MGCESEDLIPCRGMESQKRIYDCLTKDHPGLSFHSLPVLINQYPSSGFYPKTYFLVLSEREVSIPSR